MDKQQTNANKQENQSGQQVERGSQSQQRSLSHPGWYGSFGISPADFFRMGPVSLMRRMNEEMDRMFGDVSVGAGWTPAIEVQQHDDRAARSQAPS